MANATLVQVLDATDEFKVELGSLLLIQASISDDKIEQFPAVGMLHDHEKLLLRLNYLHNKYHTSGQQYRQARAIDGRKRQLVGFYSPRRAG